MKRKTISKNWKKQLFILQTGKCFYCDLIISFNKCVGEHRTPVSRGGSSKPSNFVLSCVECDRIKANLTVEEFKPEKAHIKYKVEQKPSTKQPRQPRIKIFGRRLNQDQLQDWYDSMLLDFPHLATF